MDKDEKVLIEVSINGQCTGRFVEIYRDRR